MIIKDELQLYTGQPGDNILTIQLENKFTKNQASHVCTEVRYMMQHIPDFYWRKVAYEPYEGAIGFEQA